MPTQAELDLLALKAYIKGIVSHTEEAIEEMIAEGKKIIAYIEGKQEVPATLEHVNEDVAKSALSENTSEQSSSNESSDNGVATAAVALAVVAASCLAFFARTLDAVAELQLAQSAWLVPATRFQPLPPLEDQVARPHHCIAQAVHSPA